MARWASWEKQKALCLTRWGFKTTARTAPICLKHVYRTHRSCNHTLVPFCMWLELTKSQIFLMSCSSLSVFASCSHTFFWPQKERKGSLWLAVSFKLQAAEREAEDITGHMGPCGEALMTEWDANSLLWSLPTTQYITKVMQMENTNSNVHVQRRFLKAHSHPSVFALLPSQTRVERLKPDKNKRG